MDKKSFFRKALIILTVVLVGVQLIRPEKNNKEFDVKNNIEHSVVVPENVKLILKTACYDCHSNKTEYPWYAEIMPFGNWLNHHVKEGKQHLNFSEFATYTPKKQDHKLEEIAEEIGEREMPLSSYTILHQNAKLTDIQIFQLQAWVDSARSELKGKNF